MNRIQAFEMADGPTVTRPAFVGWQAGGRQDFPVDRVADAARDRALRAAGKITVRRIPAAAVNLN
jgi:hypothetical protein